MMDPHRSDVHVIITNDGPSSLAMWAAHRYDVRGNRYDVTAMCRIITNDGPSS